MPELDHGFVTYTDAERYLMREHGLCIYCDHENTCAIRKSHLGVMRSWNGSGEHLKMLVSHCSKHEVNGHKTFARIIGE